MAISQDGNVIGTNIESGVYSKNAPAMIQSAKPKNILQLLVICYHNSQFWSCPNVTSETFLNITWIN